MIAGQLGQKKVTARNVGSWCPGLITRARQSAAGPLMRRDCVTAGSASGAP